MSQSFLSTKSPRGHFLLIFALLFMFGCSQKESPLIQEEVLEANQILVMTSPPTETGMIITDMPPLISTMTTEPIGTPLTIIASVTPIINPATATTMAIPTLTGIGREAVFANFMATNGGCDLPCWWGFKLGDNLESVNQTFLNLGIAPLVIGSSSKVDSDRMGSRNAGYADYYTDAQHRIVADYRLDISLQFHELNGFIGYIYVFANRVRFEESQQEFVRDWEQYFLSSFLQRYGQPTQVYFRLRDVADVMDPPQFSVSLLYREQGLAITYHIIGTWLYEEDIRAEFCLDLKNVQAIELSLFNPEGFDRWGYQFAPYHDELYEPLTWEAQFGMSLDTFYETYQHPENLTCLSFDLN